MFFQEFLKVQRPVIPIYLDCARGNWIKQVQVEEGKWDYQMRVNTGDRELDKFILSPEMGGVHSAVNWLVLARLFSEGLKVFKFKADTLEAMENYDLNLDAIEYHQPFSTVVIDLPDNYCTDRVIPYEYGLNRVTAPAMPAFMVVNRNGNIINVLLAFEGWGNICFVILLEPGKTVEQCWDHESLGRGLTHVENELSNRMVRTALNACMLAAHHGVRQQPPDNLSHLERTRGRLARARLRGDEKAVKSNQAELACIPISYTINQEVAIYSRQPAPRVEGTPTGTHVKTHWRRGHWRSQRYGAGLQLMRRVPIPAVLVNAHMLLAGDTSNTTYTAKE
jgi:hypothetical protein